MGISHDVCMKLFISDKYCTDVGLYLILGSMAFHYLCQQLFLWWLPKCRTLRMPVIPFNLMFLLCEITTPLQKHACNLKGIALGRYIFMEELTFLARRWNCFTWLWVLFCFSIDRFIAAHFTALLIISSLLSVKLFCEKSCQNGVDSLWEARNVEWKNSEYCAGKGPETRLLMDDEPNAALYQFDGGNSLPSLFRHSTYCCHKGPRNLVTAA